MARHFTKALTAAALAIILTSGSPAEAPTLTQTAVSLVTPEVAPSSTPDSEQLDIEREATLRAARVKAEEKAAAAARVAEQKVKPVENKPSAKIVAPTSTTASTQNFHAWVNATLAKYGVSPGPSATFRVGNTAFCGGYMCTTTIRYGSVPASSVTVVSPGAIGNEFALIHEVAHQKGVGFKDTGGECAADVWARQYVSGSIYC